MTHEDERIVIDLHSLFNFERRALLSSLELRLLFDPTLCGSLLVSTISLAPITNYLDLGNSFWPQLPIASVLEEKTVPTSYRGFLRRNSGVRS